MMNIYMKIKFNSDDKLPLNTTIQSSYYNNSY